MSASFKPWKGLDKRFRVKTLPVQQEDYRNYPPTGEFHLGMVLWPPEGECVYQNTPLSISIYLVHETCFGFLMKAWVSENLNYFNIFLYLPGVTWLTHCKRDPGLPCIQSWCHGPSGWEHSGHTSPQSCVEDRYTDPCSPRSCSQHDCTHKL